jgi:hypothetical protein
MSTRIRPFHRRFDETQNTRKVAILYVLAGQRR